jgi:(p)ppGpp synthase/HD superfamily hydrolase
MRNENDVEIVERLRNSPSDIIQVAMYAHMGQVDKAGRPYILHPMRVAHRVAMGGGSFHQVTAAWLHDVVEDTHVTLEDLAGMVQFNHFYEHALKIIQVLTHEKNEPYSDYIARILTVPGAKAVKRADILDNMDLGRLSCLDTETAARLWKKYDKALAQLDEG